AAVLQIDIDPEGIAERRVELSGREHWSAHGQRDVFERHLRYIDIVEFREQRPLRQGCSAGWRAELLALEILGFGDAAALAGHDREGRPVVDDEDGLDRRPRVAVAILDQRI